MAKGLNVDSDTDGAYESAVKMREVYGITLAAIREVCPAGTVDYYQSAWNKSHESACQFSAQDSICQQVAANKQQEEQKEQEAIAKQQMQVCEKQIAAEYDRVLPYILGNADASRAQYRTTGAAVIAVTRDLMSKGICPDSERTRGILTYYRDMEAREEISIAQQPARDAQFEREYAAEMEEMERKIEIENSGSPSIIETLVPAMGGAFQQHMQQQQEPSSGGSYPSSSGCQGYTADGVACGVR